jgi:hypothetical protein
MEHAAHPGALRAQDLVKKVVGLAAVDEYGKIELAGEGELQGEGLDLGLGRAGVGREVEADLAHGNGVIGCKEGTDLVERKRVFEEPGMDAESGEDLGRVKASYFGRAKKGGAIVGRDDEGGNTGGLGTRDDGGEGVGEGRIVEVAMGVDEHGGLRWNDCTTCRGEEWGREEKTGKKEGENEASVWVRGVEGWKSGLV